MDRPLLHVARLTGRADLLRRFDDPVELGLLSDGKTSRLQKFAGYLFPLPFIVVPMVFHPPYTPAFPGVVHLTHLIDPDRSVERLTLQGTPRLDRTRVSVDGAPLTFLPGDDNDRVANLKGLDPIALQFTALPGAGANERLLHFTLQSRSDDKTTRHKPIDIDRIEACYRAPRRAHYTRYVGDPIAIGAGEQLCVQIFGTANQPVDDQRSIVFDDPGTPSPVELDMKVFLSTSPRELKVETTPGITVRRYILVHFNRSG